MFRKDDLRSPACCRCAGIKIRDRDKMPPFVRFQDAGIEERRLCAIDRFEVGAESQHGHLPRPSDDKLISILSEWVDVCGNGIGFPPRPP